MLFSKDNSTFETHSKASTVRNNMKHLVIYSGKLLATLGILLITAVSAGNGATTTTAATNPAVGFPAQKLLAGGAARSFAQAVLYPVDAMRTLAQTRDGRTLADLGMSTLTKGCLQTSSFALVQGALQFGIFGACRDRGMNPLTSSALGAAGSCLVSVPQEIIKQRLVTGVYKSFRHAVSTIYQQEGIPGFYSNWRPNVMRNVPFVIITFCTMDAIKKRRLVNRDEKELSMGENVLIGMSSAMLAGFVTHPVDFIKTRMMTQAASTAVPYKSALDCVKTVLRTEGPLQFYSGLKQRSVYMCGLWGITFALNGKFNKLINENNNK